MKVFNLIVLVAIALMFSCSENELILADRAYEAGDYTAAIEAYSQHLRLHPTNTKALFNRGRAYEEIKEYDKAQADFQAIIMEQPGHVEANISIGMDHYFRKSEYMQCIKYMNDALESDRKSAKAYTLRGKSYQKLGQLGKAEQDYNTAISVNRNYADAYYSRASLKIYQNKTKDACGDFAIALSLGLEMADEAIKKYCK